MLISVNKEYKQKQNYCMNTFLHSKFVPMSKPLDWRKVKMINVIHITKNCQSIVLPVNAVFAINVLSGAVLILVTPLSNLVS